MCEQQSRNMLNCATLRYMRIIAKSVLQNTDQRKSLWQNIRGLVPLLLRPMETYLFLMNLVNTTKWNFSWNLILVDTQPMRKPPTDPNFLTSQSMFCVCPHCRTEVHFLYKLYKSKRVSLVYHKIINENRASQSLQKWLDWRTTLEQLDVALSDVGLAAASSLTPLTTWKTLSINAQAARDWLASKKSFPSWNISIKQLFSRHSLYAEMAYKIVG